MPQYSREVLDRLRVNTQEEAVDRLQVRGMTMWRDYGWNQVSLRLHPTISIGDSGRPPSFIPVAGKEVSTHLNNRMIVEAGLAGALKAGRSLARQFDVDFESLVREVLTEK